MSSACHTEYDNAESEAALSDLEGLGKAMRWIVNFLDLLFSIEFWRTSFVINGVELFRNYYVLFISFIFLLKIRNFIFCCHPRRTVPCDSSLLPSKETSLFQYVLWNLRSIFHLAPVRRGKGSGARWRGKTMNHRHPAWPAAWTLNRSGK